MPARSVGRSWAASHKTTLAKVLSVHNKSMAWFSDPQNRAEAIKIMVDASKLKEADVAKSYDFLHQHEFFENTGKVSRRKMSALLDALKAARRHRRLDRCRALPAAGHHATDGLSWSGHHVSGVEGIEVERAAPAAATSQAAALLFRRPAFGPRRVAAVGIGQPLPRRQHAVSRRSLADLHGHHRAGPERRAVAAHVGQRDRVRARLRDRERARRDHRLCDGRTAPPPSGRCSRGFRASTPRRRSRSRRCSFSGSASASGRRCWW